MNWNRGCRSRFAIDAGAAGLAAVSAILAAAPGGTRRDILKNLSRHDRPLAGKLRPDRFLFAELIELDDAALLTVFKAADPELIVLALAGAPAELVKRITEQLPIEQGRALSRRLGASRPDAFSRCRRVAASTGQSGNRSRGGRSDFAWFATTN